MVRLRSASEAVKTAVAPVISNVALCSVMGYRREGAGFWNVEKVTYPQISNISSNKYLLYMIYEYTLAPGLITAANEGLALVLGTAAIQADPVPLFDICSCVCGGVEFIRTYGCQAPQLWLLNI